MKMLIEAGADVNGQTATFGRPFKSLQLVGMYG